MTQSADVHYLRPALGKRLTASAKTLKAGRSVAYVQAEVCDEQGRVVTAGGYELFYVDKK